MKPFSTRVKNDVLILIAKRSDILGSQILFQVLPLDYSTSQANAKMLSRIIVLKAIKASITTVEQ